MAVVGAPCLLSGPAKAGFSLGGTFAHRLANLHLASFHLELPVLGIPNRTAPATSYSAIFFTPAIKFRLSLPAFSPFLSVEADSLIFPTAQAQMGPTQPEHSSLAVELT